MAEELRGFPLSENIDLLSQLCKIPVPASVNDPESAIERFKGMGVYTLPFKYEMQTAKAFSILLPKALNSDKVGALCIEEKPDGSGLIIRIAINYGNQEERRNTLQRVSNILMAVAREGKWRLSRQYRH
jgi:hypothetical protein